MSFQLPEPIYAQIALPGQAGQRWLVDLPRLVVELASPLPIAGLLPI